MLAIESPLPLFVGRDGLPLDAGYIYFGTVDLNPITSPITVYWDAAGTQPVAQPVRTSRGLIVRSGTPAKVYASVNFSLLVKDSAGTQVVYERNSSEWQVSAYVDEKDAELRSDFASTLSTKGSELVGYLRSLASAFATTVREWLGWQDVDPFEFMTAAQRADVIAGTSTLDVSAAWQAAITAAAGKPIRMRAGVHRIDTALTYTTSGESPGLKIKGDGVGKAFFDTRVANGFLLTLDGTGTPSTYALGLDLQGFSVITNASAANSGGILVKGQWLGSIHKTKIKNITGDGIKIVNDNSDADASGFLTIEKNWIQGCGGWGINVPDPATSSNASGHISIKKNYVTGNTLGGIRLLGAKTEVTENSIAYNTGGGGLVIPYSASSGVPNLIDIDRNEFDGNTGYHIDIQACVGSKITHNKFVYHANMTGVRIGDGGAGLVQDVHCDSNFHRRDSGTVTAHLIGSNAFYTQIKSAYYPSLTGVTPITDAGTNTEIFQSGKWTKSAVGTTTTTTSGSYTPIIGDAVYHRIVVNAIGAFTVNAPTGGGDGMELELDIYNASGGAITVTFNAVFAIAGYTDPANNKRRTSRFRYHATSAKWLQMGSWSPDI